MSKFQFHSKLDLDSTALIRCEGWNLRSHQGSLLQSIPRWTASYMWRKFNNRTEVASRQVAFAQDLRPLPLLPAGRLILSIAKGHLLAGAVARSFIFLLSALILDVGILRR